MPVHVYTINSLGKPAAIRRAKNLMTNLNDTRVWTAVQYARV